MRCVLKETCVLTFTPTQVARYAFALQLENFATMEDTVPLSTMPLQFTIMVYNSLDPCDAIPTLVEPTPECDSTLYACGGKPWTKTSIAENGTSSAR